MSEDRNQFNGLEPLTRRRLLRNAGVGLSALTLPAVLAACGDDGASTTATGASTTTSGASGPPIPSGRIDYLGFEGLDFKSSREFQQFMRQHGATVQSRYWTSFKDGIAAFPSGRAGGIDIIHASSSRLPQLFEFGEILQPLDPNRIPNLRHLTPEFQGSDKPWYHEGRLYAVPFATSPFSLNWLESRVRRAPTSWADLKDPSYKGRLCIYNDPAALMWTLTETLRLGPQGRLPKSAGKVAAEELKKYVDNARVLAPGLGDVITAFTNGDIDACFCGSPIISVIAQQSGARDCRFNMTPTDGNTLGAEAQGIPVTSDNVESAYAYLNQALTPPPNADFANILVGAPSVEGAQRLLTPETAAAFPPGMIARMERTMPYSVPLPLYSDEYLTEAEWTEEWTAVTGA